jgi:hypothetical protein
MPQAYRRFISMIVIGSIGMHYGLELLKFIIGEWLA